MKIARVTPILKSGDTSFMTNYLPIYVLPCFPKLLESRIDNRLCKYLTEKNVLYCKQFGFQKGQSPEHSILQVVEKINHFLKRMNLVLMCLSIYPAFDTIDHQILLKELNYCGIDGNIVRCLKTV